MAAADPSARSSKATFRDVTFKLKVGPMRCYIMGDG